MKSITQLLLLICTFVSLSGFSQTLNPVEVNVNRDIDVAKVYEQVVIDGYGNAQIYKVLANAYFSKNEYTQAKKWFEKLFDSESASEKNLKDRYRKTLEALNMEIENNTYLASNGKD